MRKRQDAIVVVIDMQERLMLAIDCSEDVCKNAEVLLEGASILDLPILATEQYPEALGVTVEPIHSLVERESISKLSFSCCGVEEFNTALKASGRRHVIVMGVEAHVCVYQTVRDLLDDGFEVSVVIEAVGSRTPSNKEVALRRMECLGANLVSVEMLLFDLLEQAGSSEFKSILKVIK